MPEDGLLLDVRPSQLDPFIAVPFEEQNIVVHDLRTKQLFEHPHRPLLVVQHARFRHPSELRIHQRPHTSNELPGILPSCAFLWRDVLPASPKEMPQTPRVARAQLHVPRDRPPDRVVYLQRDGEILAGD